MIGSATTSNRMFCNSFSFNGSWNCPVARQAHNLEVIGSNPVPATKYKRALRLCNVLFLFNLQQMLMELQFLSVSISVCSFLFIGTKKDRLVPNSANKKHTLKDFL